MECSKNLPKKQIEFRVQTFFALTYKFIKGLTIHVFFFLFVTIAVKKTSHLFGTEANAILGRREILHRMNKFSSSVFSNERHSFNIEFKKKLYEIKKELVLVI